MEADSTYLLCEFQNEVAMLPDKGEVFGIGVKDELELGDHHLEIQETAEPVPERAHLGCPKVELAEVVAAIVLLDHGLGCPHDLLSRSLERCIRCRG